MRASAVVLIFALVSGCTAPSGSSSDAGGFVMPALGDGKGDEWSEIVQMSGELAGPVSDTFGAELHRFHGWHLQSPEGVFRVEIDTHESFDPVFLLFVPIASEDGGAEDMADVSAVWVEPKPERPGVYGFGVLHRPMQEVGVELLLTSREAAADESVLPDPDARYDIRLRPVPELGPRAATVGCVEACDIRGDGAPYDVTFDGSVITVELGLADTPFVTGVTIRTSEKARLVSYSVVDEDGSAHAGSPLDAFVVGVEEATWVRVGRRASAVRFEYQTDDWWYGDFVIEEVAVNGIDAEVADEMIDFSRPETARP